MKPLTAIAASLLLTAILLSLLPVHGEEIVYENTVRFHVLAESDSEADQARKLQVRDAVLDYIAPLLAECVDYEAASRLLKEESAAIRTVAEDCLQKVGCTASVTVDLVAEWYPTRVYEDIVLPSGTYTSMKIVIGSGNGHNWWCVLFPSVCRSFSSVATDSQKEDYIAAGFTPEQYRMIQKNAAPNYKVRFKVLEMLSDFLHWNR